MIITPEHDSEESKGYTASSCHIEPAFSSKVNPVKNHPICKNMTFIKHPEENNKDHQAVQQVLNNSNHLVTKICQRQHLAKESSKTVLNERVGQTFNFIVDEIKDIHRKLPNKADRVIIEIKAGSWNAVHYIITKSMYFFLECDGKGNYRIEYKFYNSPFEVQIKKWIDRLV